MNNEKKLKKHEKAEKDYISGMSEKDIASKYKVKKSTVRTWKSRYKWDDKIETNVSKKCITIDGMTLEQIREDLISQLRSIGRDKIQYIIELNSYINTVEDCYEYQRDLKERGHIVEWQNGEQSGFKKNESAELKYKASAERRKILSFLGLDNIIKVNEVEDEAL